MRCIILTPAQANAARGVSKPGYALNPRPLKNGTWALPERVLLDSAHAAKQGAIANLTIRDVADNEWNTAE